MNRIENYGCFEVVGLKILRKSAKTKKCLKMTTTAVSAGIQMEKALGLYKHLSFLFIYSLSDRFTKNL